MVTKRDNKRRIRVLSAAQWLRTIPANERKGDVTNFQRKYLGYLADIIHGSNDEARRAALRYRNGARLGKPEVMRIFKRFYKANNPKPTKPSKKPRCKMNRKPNCADVHPGPPRSPLVHPVDVASESSSPSKLCDNTENIPPQSSRPKKDIEHDTNLLLAARKAVVPILRRVCLSFYHLNKKVTISEETIVAEFLMILKHFPRQILATHGVENKDDINAAWIKIGKLFETESKDHELIGDTLTDCVQAAIYITNRFGDRRDIEGMRDLQKVVEINTD